MIHNQQFREFAIASGFNLEYNQGSQYFNSKATRIAFFKWQELQEIV